MIFHSARRNNDNLCLNLHINGRELEKVKEFSFLGTLLTSNISWKAHCSYICKKLSRTIGVLKRLKYILPTQVLLSIYNSLFVPHVTQSITVWGHKPYRIFKLQKRAIRLVFKAKYNAHTDVLFKKSNSLKFEDIYKSSLLKLYYKYNNNTLPTYFENMFDPVLTMHQYDLRQNEPRFPQPRKQFTALCIRYQIPAFISTVPSCIKDKVMTHSFKGFCNYVKRYYINLYKETCEKLNCYACRE